jgi:hypothetical protein
MLVMIYVNLVGSFRHTALTALSKLVHESLAAIGHSARQPLFGRFSLWWICIHPLSLVSVGVLAQPLWLYGI